MFRSQLQLLVPLALELLELSLHLLSLSLGIVDVSLELVHLVCIGLRFELLLLTVDVIYLVPLLLHKDLYPLELVLSVGSLRLQVRDGVLVVQSSLLQLPNLLLTGSLQ